MVPVADIIAALLIPLAAAISGFALGWAARGLSEEHNVSKTTLAHGIAILISLTWFVSVLFAMTTADYSTAIPIHAIMGAVVGYFFGSGEGLTLNLSGRE